MDLQIKEKIFVVCGAISGFGRALVKHLAVEGAKIIAIARTSSSLQDLKALYPQQIIEAIAADLFDHQKHKSIFEKISAYRIYGVLVNAGGPPAGTFDDLSLDDWDIGYQNVIKWKVSFLKAILPQMEKNGGGRILFLESSSVKQPIENLLLSNSLRMSMVGLMKTLSKEYINKNISFNMIGPGFHDTPATQRLARKKAEQLNIGLDEAERLSVESLPLKQKGNPDDFASLAAWLLSPLAKYVQGQVYFVDGGVLQSTL